MSTAPVLQQSRFARFTIGVRRDPGVAIILGVFALIFGLLLSLDLYRPMFQRVHANDPVGYFVWLRSPLFDGDFQFENEYRYLNSHIDTRLTGWADPDAPRTPTGHTPNYFALGSAMLWSPFVMAVHPIAPFLGGKQDGLSQPYHMAIFFAVTFYGLASILLLYRLLRRMYPWTVSVVAALAAWGASPMLFYTFPDGAMSHTCSMFAMCLFVYTWLRWRDHPSAMAWLLIGLSLGLATLTRWQNVTYAIVLCADVAMRFSPAAFRRLCAAGVGTIIGFVPQMIGWYIVYGSAITMPQGPDFVHWTAPDFWAFFFGAPYGLFSWTPYCAVGVAGLFVARRNLRPIYIALAIGLAVQFYVNACLYEAGWTFGMRRMDNAIPAFALGIAAFHSAIQKPWQRRAFASTAIIAVVWNFLFVLQYAGYLDGLYIDCAYEQLSRETGIPVSELEKPDALPNGMSSAEFVYDSLFPRGSGPSFDQFTWDKLLVLQKLAHDFLGTPAPK